jgi:hypothetical protein
LHTHAVHSELTSRIELCRDANGVRYQLDGNNLRNGDPLEVWTTLGWIKGDFFWEGEPYLPYLNFAEKSREPFVIVSYSLCRRPE